MEGKTGAEKRWMEREGRGKFKKGREGKIKAGCRK